MTVSKSGTWILSITLPLLVIAIVIILLLITYIRRLNIRIRNMNAYERSLSRYKARNIEFENAIAMEESQYSVENTRPQRNCPPIITEDDYEKIDSQCRPKRHNTPEQNPSANIPYGTNRQTESDQKAASSKLSDNFQPIDDDEYAEVDNDEISNESSLDYEDVQSPAKRKLAGRSGDNQDSDSRIYEECDPENQTKYEPLDSSPRPENKSYNGYENTGFKSQEESFS